MKEVDDSKSNNSPNKSAEEEHGDDEKIADEGKKRKFRELLRFKLKESIQNYQKAR